jgi:signal peptidase I
MAELTKAKAPGSNVKPKGPSDFFTANRETVESVVVAIILALLFRAFIAEAFVIPTGSMAPTLMGRHVDLWCDQCEFHFQASASAERDGNDAYTGLVVATARCPNCGFRNSLDRSKFSNEVSFSGDRIIVSKAAYQLGDPQRWDVIVFKYPKKAQQNYIKRLIGLPNETVRLAGGNVYVKGEGDSDFAIARKHDDTKLLALLQVVHDADYPAEQLIAAGWPARWQSHSEEKDWQSDELGTTHTLATTKQEAWLRYHHFDPWLDAWSEVTDGKQPTFDPDWQGGLITDFYAYNSEQVVSMLDPGDEPNFPYDSSPAFGQYWVDDLALEVEVEVGEATGEILLDLVRGGVHYLCRIDTTSGKATLETRGNSDARVRFTDGIKEHDTVSAATPVRGGGTYHLRLSNVDHEVRLWVNNRRIPFEGPTTYKSETRILPDVESTDGDLAPAGVGGKNQSLTVRHLRLLRDKYYVASKENSSEYSWTPPPSVAANRMSPQAEIVHWFNNPTPERMSKLLGSRRELTFEIGADQFMPLGDNSPASSDARYWSESQPSFGRHLLVGKALFIYWPHTWNSPPYLPNFRRMQPIH